MLVWQPAPTMLDKQTLPTKVTLLCLCSPSAHLKVFLQALSLNEGDRSFMQAGSGSHSIMWLCICTCRMERNVAQNTLFSVLLDKNNLITAGIEEVI